MFVAFLSTSCRPVAQIEGTSPQHLDKAVLPGREATVLPGREAKPKRRLGDDARGHTISHARVVVQDGHLVS